MYDIVVCYYSYYFFLLCPTSLVLTGSYEKSITLVLWNDSYAIFVLTHIKDVGGRFHP